MTWWESVPKILAIWSIATVLLVVTIDMAAILGERSDMTVSHWIYKTCQRNPYLYLILGFLLGHLAYPLVIHLGGNGKQ